MRAEPALVRVIDEAGGYLAVITEVQAVPPGPSSGRRLRPGNAAWSATAPPGCGSSPSPRSAPAGHGSAATAGGGCPDGWAASHRRVTQRLGCGTPSPVIPRGAGPPGRGPVRRLRPNGVAVLTGR